MIYVAQVTNEVEDKITFIFKILSVLSPITVSTSKVQHELSMIVSNSLIKSANNTKT